MDIKKAGVLGAGQMGSGIAQLLAMAGIQTIMVDAYEQALTKGKAAIEKSLTKLESKGKLSGSAQNILSNITISQNVADFSGVDIVIEAVSENFELKKTLFEQLDNVCKPEAILASNTSSISITKMGALTKRPQKVIGMHFMNPPAIMKLVEIINGLDTSEETYTITKVLAEKLGKETIKSEDSPGFVVNRILLPMINEAINVLQENLATPQDIDKGMVLGTNQPIGPLALADLIGLDTVLFILQILHKEIGDPKFRPAVLLQKYVAAGHLGRKTGRGFYTYS